MKLLALLLVLALRRLEWREQRLRPLLRRLLLAPAPLAAMLAVTAGGRLLVLVLFWAAIGFLVRFGVNDWLLSLPLLATYVLLLWALVGRDRLGEDLNEYLRRWYLHEPQELAVFARERFGVEADSPGALHRAVLRALFVRAFRENYAWIIVFALTGLPGLLVLALLDAAGNGNEPLLAREAQDMRARLDWLLARLLGVTLRLTGNSARAWPMLDNRLLDDEDPAEELVAAVCVAAAGVSPQAPEGEAPDVGLDITDARGLLLRTQVVWIMLMAVSVIIGF